MPFPTNVTENTVYIDDIDQSWIFIKNKWRLNSSLSPTNTAVPNVNVIILNTDTNTTLTLNDSRDELIYLKHSTGILPNGSQSISISINAQNISTHRVGQVKSFHTNIPTSVTFIYKSGANGTLTQGLVNTKETISFMCVSVQPLEWIKL